MVKENHIKNIDGFIRANLIINQQPFSSKIIFCSGSPTRTSDLKVISSFDNQK